MNLLLIGSGGREHALAWKIAQSPQLARFYAAPGNPGIAAHAACVSLDVLDPGSVSAFCQEKRIDLVVVGPEAPLVAGLVDHLEGAGILAFGPTQAAAALEGSKGFAKDLCRAHGIPTAAYERFSDAAQAKAYVAGQNPPIVIKADGLAAGKGVVIAQTPAEAVTAIEAMLAEPGAQLVIEAFLDGEEASFFALCDGDRAIPFGSAQDHKRAFDGDHGPNTGGMGAYSPAPVLTLELERQTMDEIVMPTLRAMARRGTPFRGILYAGLMLTKKGPKLIEYNVRFGDPEAQVLMRRLNADIVPLLTAAAKGDLRDAQIAWSDQTALCVVLAAKGYPGAVKKGSLIQGLEKAEAIDGVTIFHAATRRKDNQLLAEGGRVLGVTATGSDIAKAHKKAYQAVDLIDWPEGFCRRDIGWRAIRDLKLLRC